MDDAQVGPGDVVTLLSGGLPMTVAWIENNEAAFCCWHTAAGDLKQEHIPLRTLRKVPAGVPYSRPPRTGYRDERGLYHPAPGSTGFAEHAGGCVSCAREVGCTPDGNGKLRPSGLTGADLGPIDMPVAPLRGGKR